MGEYDNALEQYNAALKIQPNWIEVLINKSEALECYDAATLSLNSLQMAQETYNNQESMIKQFNIMMQQSKSTPNIQGLYMEKEY